MDSEKQVFDGNEVIDSGGVNIRASRAGYLKKHLIEYEECREKLENFEKTPRMRQELSLDEQPGVESVASVAMRPVEQASSRDGLAVWAREHRVLVFALGVLCVLGLLVFLVRQMNRPGLALPDQARVAEVRKLRNSSELRDEEESILASQRRNQLAAISQNMETSAGQGEMFAATRRPMAAERLPMIARSMSLVIVTKEFAGARAALEALLVRHHGYAAEMAANTQQSSAKSLTASLRIPAGELGVAVAELRALGTVGSESQKGEEVTQQHSDLVARLKNSRETEQRLQAILQQRTGKMSDVLEVEQEISRVRGEIEGMEGELKGLEHRVDFTTVDLTLNEEYRAELGTPSLSNRFRNSVVNGFQSAADMVVWMLLFCLNFGPSLLLWAAILFLPVRFAWKRRHGVVLKEVN